jgi:simple sugar transport system ATP-binding protein
VIAALDIAIPRLGVPVRALSGGQRQAVAIGRALLWNAAVLIMDEPTAALGVPEQRKVLALVGGLKAAGKAVIFISHNLADMFTVADRILVLHRGRKAGERQIASTNSDEVVRLMVGGA